MKYLVMECFTSYAVLLDEEGRFVKAANLHYQVGQTVEDPILMREEDPKSKKKIYRFGSFAAVAASLLLLFNIYYQNNIISHTSIYLSINPSVCMELNRKGEVVKVTGMNADGVALLEGYERSSKNRLIVTDELIDRAIDMGFLADGGQIVIDIDAPDEAYFQQYGKELRASVTAHLNERMVVEIRIQSYSEETGQENQQEDTVPANAVPDSGTSGDGTVNNGTVNNGTTNNNTPNGSTPNNSVPNYSATDYGDSGGQEVDTNIRVEIDLGGDSGYQEVENVSSYGDSGYQEAVPPSTGGDSSYGDSVYEEAAPPSTGGDSSYGDSVYEEAVPPSTGGDSSYGDSVYEEAVTPSTSGDSGYEEVVPPGSYGDSGYETDDDGGSGYS